MKPRLGLEKCWQLLFLMEGVKLTLISSLHAFILLPKNMPISGTVVTYISLDLNDILIVSSLVLMS